MHMEVVEYSYFSDDNFESKDNLNSFVKKWLNQIIKIYKYMCLIIFMR